jgi:hypothetical protein
MIAYRTTILGGLAAVLLLLAACGGNPYVFNNDEFNRQADYYLNGLKDRGDVSVCYSKRRTTPLAISNLAMAECQRFGKTAAFSETSYSICPLNTPVAAVYKCLAPGESSANTGS